MSWYVLPRIGLILELASSQGQITNTILSYASLIIYLCWILLVQCHSIHHLPADKKGKSALLKERMDVTYTYVTGWSSGNWPYQTLDMWQPSTSCPMLIHLLSTYIQGRDTPPLEPTTLWANPSPTSCSDSIWLVYIHFLAGSVITSLPFHILCPIPVSKHSDHPLNLWTKSYCNMSRSW